MFVITNLRRDHAQRFPNWPHPNCFVCGQANGCGLHLEFTLKDGQVSSRFGCDKEFEGYPGVLHGGIISSVVYGAMTNCLFAHAVVAMTAELNVRFRSPVVVGRSAKVFAQLLRSDAPLFVVEAKIVQDGKIKVTATGKFLEKPNLTEPAPV